jgi:hypothetical protein
MKMLSSTKKIAVAGCKDTTADLLIFFKENNIEVSLLITINPEMAEKK